MKKLSFLFIAIAVIVIPCFCEEPLKITGVTAGRIGDYDHVEIKTSSSAKPVVLDLDTHNQVAVIFSNATIEKAFNVPPPSDRIKNIQVVQFNQSTVYVIIELNKELEYDMATLIGKNKTVIEFGREKPEKEEPTAKISATSEATAEARPAEAEVVKIAGEEKPKKGLPEDLNIYILGKAFPNKHKVIIKDGTAMVPARIFFDAINATSDINDKTNTFSAKQKYEWRIVLKAGSKDVLLKLVDDKNDKYINKYFSVTMAPSYVRNNLKKEFYIPLASVAKILGYDASWDKDRTSLYISSRIVNAKIFENGPVKRICIATNNTPGEVKKRKEENTIYLDFIGAKLDTKDNPMTIRGNDYDIKLYQFNDLIVTAKIFIKNMQYFTTSDFEEKDMYEMVFAPALTDIEYSRVSATASKISISASDTIDHEIKEYKDPQRIVIDMKNVILKPTVPPQTDSAMIKDIRMSQTSMNPLMAGVVITLNNTTYKSYLSKDKKKLSIIINDAPKKTALQKLFPLKGRTIVIDPGHGGDDPGTVGYSGILEKDLTPAVALKLCEYLYRGGANVILTKENDEPLNNKEIVQLANRNKADMFVSVHYNAFSDPGVAGIETYYYNGDSVSLAKIMYKSLVNGIKRRGRNIKKDTYYTIHHAKMPAVIVEPLYISNPKEEKLAQSAKYQDLIAASIYRGIKEYFVRQEKL